MIAFATLLGACASKRPIELPADAPPTECAAHGRGACEAACERGDGTACLAASIGYATSPGADFPKMRELEQRACSLGIALGCFHYASNFTGGARQDLALADEYDAKACDAGLVKGCMRRAARALEATNDGIADPKLAMAMLNRVCELQPGIVCAMAADLHALGIGVPRDESAARAGYARACAAKSDTTAITPTIEAIQATICRNAEHDDGELFVSLPLPTVFEPLYMADPNIALPNAAPGWRAAVTVRFCFEKGASKPTHVAIVESIDEPELEAAMLHTVREWRVRVRPFVTSARPLCRTMTFDIRRG